MNTIASHICVGAPCSEARYRELEKAQKLLPICADCIEKAPANLRFSALGIAAQWPSIASSITVCYVCEEKKHCCYASTGELSTSPAVAELTCSVKSRLAED